MEPDTVGLILALDGPLVVLLFALVLDRLCTQARRRERELLDALIRQGVRLEAVEERTGVAAEAVEAA